MHLLPIQRHYYRLYGIILVFDWKPNVLETRRFMLTSGSSYYIYTPYI